MASIPFIAGESRTDIRHSRLASLLLVLAVLGALGGLSYYFSHRSNAHDPATAGNHRRPTATVAFAVAAHTDIPIRLDALGTVTPIAAATVQPQVERQTTAVSLITSLGGGWNG